MVPPRKRFGQRMGQFEDAERKPKVSLSVKLASWTDHLVRSPTTGPPEAMMKDAQAQLSHATRVPALY